MYVENANRAVRDGAITPENLEPNPKNPIIASFFNQIGYADEIGSGTRYLFKYVKRYSGKLPEIIEGDVFRIIVPLDDTYSFDLSLGRENIVGEGKVIYGTKDDTLKLNRNKNDTLNDTLNDNRTKSDILKSDLTSNEKVVLHVIKNMGDITQKEISLKTSLSPSTVKRVMKNLMEKGILIRVGSKRTGVWKVLLDSPSK